jgi:hypothetical protein
MVFAQSTLASDVIAWHEQMIPLMKSITPHVPFGVIFLQGEILPEVR